MSRWIQTLSVLFVGSWFVLLAVQPSAAQQPVELLSEPLSIADFGLEGQIPSAIDLVGPEQGSAGQSRAELVRRFQCWVDGLESCSALGLNDPRVRAIRRFLVRGRDDRDGVVIVGFPDQSRVEVRVARNSALDPNDWDQSVYLPVVLPDTVQAPGLPDIPSRPDHFDGLAYNVPPAIQAALERLKQRFD
ncbi:MAG: hypothetical protein HND55_04420 [Pseudomonadota bacterium]|nr:MAG: hypothetical protein HND55_04420 [Pseudomonadota bacterium]